jgi:dihydrofolate reductase
MLAIVACARSGTSGSLDSGTWAHYLGTKSDPAEGDHRGQADLLSDHLARRVYRGRRWQLRLGAPDEEVHSFVNDLERPVGTYLYGRRMYETMVYWETVQVLADEPPCVRDFTQLWQGADKIVYSTSLETVSSAKTRIERKFDPGVIQEMKSSQERDIAVGGPNLAAQAFKAGLVDECQLFLTLIVVGGGKPSLPNNVRVDLELLSERRFRSGVVFLHYRTSMADSEHP